MKKQLYKTQLESHTATKMMLAMIFIGVILPIVSAAEPKTILFDTEQLINITGVRCLQQNNTPCGTGIGCNISIMNSTGGFLFSNYTMDNQDNGFKSFNTALSYNSEIELSAVVDCDNGGVEEFVIAIRFDEDLVDTTYGIYGFLLGGSVLFFILGLKKERFIYKTFSGFMLFLLGINLIINGFPNITSSYLTEGSGIAIIGLGAFFILSDVERLGELFK